MKTRSHAFQRRSDNSGIYICPDCNVDVGKLDSDDRGPGIWRGSVNVHHCDGQNWVFGGHYRGEAHHYTRVFGDCWKCGRPIGCPACVGFEKEILCENFREHGGLGAVWATRRAFLEHGPLIRQPAKNEARKQTLEDYPATWARKYEPLEVTSNAMPTLEQLVKSLTKPIAAELR